MNLRRYLNTHWIFRISVWTLTTGSLIGFLMFSHHAAASMKACFEFLAASPESDREVARFLLNKDVDLTRAEIKGLLEIRGFQHLLGQLQTIPKLDNRNDESEFKSAVASVVELFEPRNLVASSQIVEPVLRAYLMEVLSFITENFNDSKALSDTLRYLNDRKFVETLEKTMIVVDSLPGELPDALLLVHETLSRFRANYMYPPISAHEVDAMLLVVKDSLNFVASSFDNNDPEIVDRIYNEAHRAQSFINNRGLMWCALRDNPDPYIESVIHFRQLLPNLARIASPEKFKSLTVRLAGLTNDLLQMKIEASSGWEKVKQNLDKNWSRLQTAFALPPEVHDLNSPTNHPWDRIRMQYAAFFTKYPERHEYKKFVLEHLRYVLAPGE